MFTGYLLFLVYVHILRPELHGFLVCYVRMPRPDPVYVRMLYVCAHATP